MKKFTTTLASLALFFGISNAQTYCTFTSTPYSSNQPGITNVKIANINRTSPSIEGGNALVSTGQTVTLTIGQTYSFSILTSNDLVSGAPLTNAPQNVRIYIDFNKNFNFTDAGETAYSAANITPAVTHTNATAVTVPATVTPGSGARMRITAKMGSTAGHTVPSPCNVPADPLGYHGEMEEYNVVFVAATGINESAISAVSAISVYPNPFTTTANLSYDLKEAGNVSVEVFNILGEKVTLINNENQSSGNHQLKIDGSMLPKANGMYYVKVTANGASRTTKLISIN